MTLAPLDPAPAPGGPVTGPAAAPGPVAPRAADRARAAGSSRAAGRGRTLAPGLGAVLVATGACLLVNRTQPAVSALLLAIVVGAAARNAGALPDVVRPGVAWSARHLLRAGVVLLGLQLSLPALLALRPGELVLVAVTVAATFLATRWLGARLGLDRRTVLLVATGFSICGAAAVAAMSSAVPARRGGPDRPGVAGRPDDAVATAVALVTVFGSLALVAMPLAQGPLGLDDRQLGVWVGASVHEVAQVVAAASSVSAVALAVAVVVKLARVVLLAPLVAVVGAAEHRRARQAELAQRGHEGAGDPSRLATARRPAPVPLFVLGFLGAVAVRSLGVLPDVALDTARVLGTGLLTAAMLGLGADVHVATLVRTGGRAVALGAAATAVTASVSLAGIYLLA